MRRLPFSAIILFFSASAINAEAPGYNYANSAFITRDIGRLFAPLAPDETAPVWIFFTDRGLNEAEIAGALEKARADIPERTLRRRLRGGNPGVDAKDLPVNLDYIAFVAGSGAEIRIASRWFNGVSADATMEQVKNISAADFVQAVKPVARGRRIDIIEMDARPAPYRDDTELNYGASFNQLNQINVIALHDMGITGEGVLVCLLDTGYLLSHLAFQNMNIVAVWDFINGDSVVTNQPGDPEAQDDHGTLTLSACGSAVDGQLYGPAFGASFMAGKTESVEYELPIEEDFYVAGLEWADSLGADVVSTSLGYFDWYTFEDLNGDSCVTTIGVDIAVSRGIVCVTAAGNERRSGWGHIIAPSDADSVIAVGAVNDSGEIASFSSPGPTYDGRIKPEVCAQGVSTRCADPGDTLNFRTASGTSLSTPLIGGVAALLLQAHPNWPPMRVREAMMMTASMSSSPNNDYGWGIVDALAAAEYSYSPVIDQRFPPEDTVHAYIDSTIEFRVTASDLDGDPLNYSLMVEGAVWAQSDTGIFRAAVPRPDTLNIAVTVMDIIGFSDTTSWTLIVENLLSVAERGDLTPAGFSLSAHPNPFNPSTVLSFELRDASWVTLAVYDITGREVASLVNGHLSAGHHEIAFNGMDLPSGVYFAMLEAGGMKDVRKLLLVK